MDEEGNVFVPESLNDAKDLLRNMTMSRSVPTLSTLSRTSSASSTMVTSAEPQLTTAAAAVTTTTCCTTRVSTCAAFSQPAPALAQPTAAATSAATTTSSTTMVTSAVATVARKAVRDPAPAFRSSSGQQRLTPCIRGGVVQIPLSSQQKIPQLASRQALVDKNKAYMESIKEKNNTIARLETELANVTHNWEGQLTQLLWLNTIVNEKEVEVYDKDLNVSALESTVSDQASTINQLRHDYAEMQAKFICIYNHCKNVARDRQKKMDYITILLSKEEKAKEITVQQQTLTKSLLALKEKKRGTRFIDGNHSFYQGQTEPSQLVRHEMSLAAARVRKEKEEQERADLIKLSDAVDRFARKYDRYNMISHSNIHNTRCAPDGLPLIVPRDMMGLWLYADTTMNPTKEESAMYEFHLQLQVRPPPIYSPTLPKPTVNWNALNKHKRKNLPDPERFAIQTVPADPNFYLDTSKYKSAEQHRSHDYSGPVPVRITVEECGCARCVPPFGQKYGLMTDMGVIPMPDISVHGYRWDDMTASWVIATGG